MVTINRWAALYDSYAVRGPTRSSLDRDRWLMRELDGSARDAAKAIVYSRSS